MPISPHVLNTATMHAETIIEDADDDQTIRAPVADEVTGETLEMMLELGGVGQLAEEEDAQQVHYSYGFDKEP